MPVLVYTALRLLLFALLTALVWFVGMRSWLAPLAGVLLAWALGYVLLGKQRTAAAAYVERRSRDAAPRHTHADDDAEHEDAVVDAAQAAAADGEPEPRPS